MKNIAIGKYLIGENKPVFIIAEAGVNHNGSLKLAKKLVALAKQAGADAVKFQTFVTEDVLCKNAKMAEYQKKNIGSGKSQFEMIKQLELSYEDFKKIKAHCEKQKIIFLSTPDEEKSADFLFKLGVPAFKIGSGEITNLPFLKHIAKKNKPIILSTGTADLKEVRQAVNIIKGQGNNKIILLHCATNYPCPFEEVNLRAMQTLKKTFRALVGYSDHTLGIIAPMLAAAMGAQVLEKHFTLSKNLSGPDHKASLEPLELKEMVQAVRKTEKILGSSNKKPTKSEQRIKKIIRKSITAKKDIPRGAKITKALLAVKRPGTGIEPKYINKIIGKRAKKNIQKDSLIKFEKIIL